MPASEESPEAKARRIGQENATVRSVFSAMQRHVEEISQNQEFQDGFELFPEERAKLMNWNSSGVWQGVAAGILTFMALRVARSRMRSLPASLSSQSSPFQKGDQLPSVLPQQPSLLFRVLFLIIDTSFAMFSAVSVSVAMTDTTKILKEFSEIPKLNQSQVADNLCPVVAQEFDRLRTEYRKRVDAGEWVKSNGEKVQSSNEWNVTSEKSSWIEEEVDTEPKDDEWLGEPVSSPYLTSLLAFARHCKESGRSEMKKEQSEWDMSEEGFSTGS